jgi:hypothetical protein
MFDDLCHYLGWVGLVQFAVDVAQERDVAHTKNLRRRS